MYYVLSGNIAKGKPAAQSSLYGSGVPQRAVDGNTNTKWGGNSCTHTLQDNGNWWMVDLERLFAVAKIKITNVQDSVPARLRNFEIRVGNNHGSPNANTL